MLFRSGMDVFSSLIGNKGNVQDEIFIVSSHSLYRDVVKTLGLNISYYTRKNIFNNELAFPDHPLEIIPASGLLDTLKTNISFKVSVDKDGTADIKAKMRRNTVADVPKFRSSPIVCQTRHKINHKNGIFTTFL